MIPSLLANLMVLYSQTENYFFKGISESTLEVAQGAIAYRSETDLNYVYLTKEPKAIGQILKASENFYAQRNKNFEIIIPEMFCSDKIVSQMEQRGYEQIDQSVSMFISLSDIQLKEDSVFEDETFIQENNTQLQEWMQPLVGAFESTVNACSRYAQTHEKALKKGFQFYHFSLYKEKQPISSITLSICDGNARLDDVSTIPDFQGKGYGSRLVRVALLKAHELGAQYCFLEASDSGLSLYQKIGFQTLYKNKIYSINTA